MFFTKLFFLLIFQKGLTEGIVTSLYEVEKLFNYGKLNLPKLDNGINSSSSRCHSIFQLKIINEQGKLNR